MSAPPIPQRIPPLTWRQPAFLWTPIALAAAIGWPAAMFYYEPDMQRVTLVAGFIVFAIALVTLGASWMMGHAPRARRIVVLHVVIAGLIAACLTPFALSQILALVADYESSGSGQQFSLAMSLAMLPLTIVLGLPMALISGIVFAWLALNRPRFDPEMDGPHRDVQPFR